MMSWEQIKELQKSGHEIGSHSMTHALLPQLDLKSIEWEVSESRRQLGEILDFESESFCYPNGDQDKRVRSAVQSAGSRPHVRRP